MELTEKDYCNFPTFKKKRRLDEDGARVEILQDHLKLENMEFLKNIPRTNSFDWVVEILEIGYNKNKTKILKVITNEGEHLYVDYNLMKKQNPRLLCKFYQSKLSVVKQI